MKKGVLALAGAVLIVSSAVAYFVMPGTDRREPVQSANIKAMVEEFSMGTRQAKAASINSHELIVTDDNKNQTVYELPKDEFFVSIAPYEEVTHPCAIHSLTGCQGELESETFQVLVKDPEGNVVLDQPMTSYENGFIDLWLPRDQKYHVTISQDGKSQEAVITTFEGDNTCITTIQLKDPKSA